MFERLFKLKERNTTVKIEVLAGLTTFMTMGYIIFVNPAILHYAGIPLHDAITATCLTAGLTTILMGLYANYPFALAVIFLEGIIITILVLTRVREWVMDAIPLSLKRAIGVGIGLFIAFIGLNQGWIVEASPATMVTFADPTNVVALITFFGLFIITAALMLLRVRAAILLGIVLSTILALGLGLIKYQVFIIH